MMARTDRELRHRQIEVLGREFTVVREGLDPGEVVDFLEAVAGSSEAAFRRLEQFSAFQAFSRTMGDSIGEARALAEHAKNQVKIEAQQTRQRAGEELKRQVGQMLDRTRASCVAAMDDAYTVLLGALTEAQKVEWQAFERAKEMISLNLATVHQNIRDMMEADIYRSGDTQKPDEAPDRLGRPAKTLAQKNRGAVVEPVAAAVATEHPATGSPAVPEAPPALRAERSRPPIATANDGARLDVETVRIDPREGEHHSVGDVAIVVPEDAEALWVRQLRQRMLGTPGVQILNESGGDGDALTLDVHLSEPMELLSMLQRMPNVRSVIKSQPGNAKRSSGENASRTVLTMVLR
jgi:hypothetical protein